LRGFGRHGPQAFEQLGGLVLVEDPDRAQHGDVGHRTTDIPRQEPTVLGGGGVAPQDFVGAFAEPPSPKRHTGDWRIIWSLHDDRVGVLPPHPHGCSDSTDTPGRGHPTSRSTARPPPRTRSPDSPPHPTVTVGGTAPTPPRLLGYH